MLGQVRTGKVGVGQVRPGYARLWQVSSG